MSIELCSRSRQRGLSLIELMIALVLGLFIIGGVISVFVGSTRSFDSNEALSRVQENGRFALDMIAEELRNTGYKGSCFIQVNEIIDTADPSYVADALDINNPIKGWDNAAGEFFSGSMTNYVNGTDIIIIKHAAENANAVLSNTTGLNQNITTIPTTGGAESGQIVVLSEGSGCDIFQNTAASATADLERSPTDTAQAIIGNKTTAVQGLIRPYSSDKTDILLFNSTLFYVGSGTTASTALRSISYDNGIANDQELVEGVNNLVFAYGVVSGAGPALDYSNTATQIEAASRWGDVVAVRVGLDVIGDENINHRFLTTVALRNRLQ